MAQLVRAPFRWEVTGSSPVVAIYIIRKEQDMTLIKILWAITIGAIVGSYTYYIKRDHYLDESNAWLLLFMYAVLGVASLAL